MPTCHPRAPRNLHPASPPNRLVTRSGARARSRGRRPSSRGKFCESRDRARPGRARAREGRGEDRGGGSQWIHGPRPSSLSSSSSASSYPVLCSSSLVEYAASVEFADLTTLIAFPNYMPDSDRDRLLHAGSSFELAHVHFGHGCKTHPPLLRDGVKS